MRLVDEIVDLLSAETPSVQNALFKAQVLAHRLGEDEFREWVDHELKGYPRGADVPAYRVLPVTVMGTISNGAYRYTSQPLPVMHLKDGLRKRLQENRLHQSIAVIEEWSKDESKLSVVIEPEMYSFLSEALGNGYEVERAWGKNSIGAMLQVITQVRSRLLEFALQLSDRLPHEEAACDIKQISKDVDVGDLFRNSVFGDNVVINIGSGSVVGVRSSVVKNDFESLAGVLKANGVADEDIAELRTAVQEDESCDGLTGREFGPHVRNWLGAMVAKAGTAGWKVSIGAAGALLAKALAAYYGVGA